MAQFCSACGAQMADGTAACAACGKGAAAAPGAAASGSGLQDNVAGLLAYVTIIPAIIFLVMEPYNRNKFIRFHAFQCLFMAGTAIVTQIVLTIIPIIGLILLPFAMLGIFVMVVIAAIKAYQGKKFKIPVIGNIAEKQADNVA